MQNINLRLLDSLKERNINIDVSKITRQIDLENKKNLNEYDEYIKNKEIKKDSGKKESNIRSRMAYASEKKIAQEHGYFGEKNVKPSPTKQSNFDDELSEKCDTESESSSSITNVQLKKFDEFDLFDMQEEIKKEFLQDELTEEIVAKLADCPIDHLELVYKLSMKTDLTFNNLANLTTYVPNLKDLRLNGSIVNSIRDLGSGLSNLESLSISRCQLLDLSGIGIMMQLKELFCSYNSISDVSDLMYHNCLCILDLDGNDISEMEQVENLNTIESLQSLCLSSNPISKDQNYRKKVLDLMPLLEYLDDIKRSETQEAEIVSQVSSEKFTQSKEYKDLIKSLKKYGEIDEQLSEKFSSTLNQEMPDEEIITYSIKQQNKKGYDQRDRDRVLYQTFSGFHSTNTNLKTIKEDTSKNNQFRSTFRQTDNIKAFYATDNKTKSNSMLAKIFAPEVNEEEELQGISRLTSNTTETFAGSAFKALRHNRNKNFTQNIEDEQGLQFQKNILHLIEDFKFDINDDDNEILDFSDDNISFTEEQLENANIYQIGDDQKIDMNSTFNKLPLSSKKEVIKQQFELKKFERAQFKLPDKPEGSTFLKNRPNVKADNNLVFSGQQKFTFKKPVFIKSENKEEVPERVNLHEATDQLNSSSRSPIGDRSPMRELNEVVLKGGIKQNTILKKNEERNVERSKSAERNQNYQDLKQFKDIKSFKQMMEKNKIISDVQSVFKTQDPVKQMPRRQPGAFLKKNNDEGEQIEQINKTFKVPTFHKAKFLIKRDTQLQQQ